MSAIRTWKYPRINKYFTVACFVTPPIVGSVVSVIYNGGALWCLLEVMRGRYSLAREPHFVATAAALYAYSAAMILATLAGSELGLQSLQLVGLVSFLLFPFSYSIWRVSDKEAIMRACMEACAAACIGGLLFAVVQVHVIGMGRAEGGAGNSLVFANVIALAGGVSLIGVFRSGGTERFIYAAGFLASVLAVVYSASRGPLIIVLANMIVVAAIYSRGRAMRMAMLAPVAALVLLTAIVASGMTPLSSRVADVFSNLSEITRDGDFSSSIGIRLALWNIAVDVWLQQPLIGYGAGKLPELISYHLTSQYNISEDFGHFHNVFLNTLVEGGVLAFLGLVAMIVIPLHAAFRVLTGTSGEAERFGAAVLVLLFTMFLITGLTNLAIRHDIMDAVFMIFLVVGLYLAIGTSVRSRADIAEPVGSPAA